MIPGHNILYLAIRNSCRHPGSYMVIVTVRYILEPRVLGDNIGLHPLVTLIALYVGLRAAGVVGIILGPALVVVFLACQRAGVFDKWFWKRVD